MDMSHDVVPKVPLVPGGGFEVDVVDVRFELIDLLVRDVQAEFFFRLGQSNPHAPPGGNSALRRPESGHLTGRVSGNQRVRVNVVAQRRLSRLSVISSFLPLGIYFRSQRSLHVVIERSLERCPFRSRRRPVQLPGWRLHIVRPGRGGRLESARQFRN